MLNGEFHIVQSNSEFLDKFQLLFQLDGGDSMESIHDESIISQLKAPQIFTNSIGMTWISEVLVKNGKVERIFVLGPAVLDDYSTKIINDRLNELNFAVSGKHIFMDLMKQIPVISLSRFQNYGVMLHRCVTGETILADDILYPDLETEKKNEAISPEDVFQNRHGTYAVEQEFLKLLEEGNYDCLEVKDKMRRSGEGAKLSGGDFMRQAKNSVIIMVTLCARAAIRGGLSSETALELSDQYIQAVEEADTLAKIKEINQRMLKDYVTRVHRLKLDDGISVSIKRSCDYIQSHLNEEIDIHLLASQMGYTDYYFSSKFKREMGCSVRDYLMNQRVARAKEMLLDGNIPIQRISDVLGFGTQSYFGKIFKKLSGMSPGEYREQQKEKDGK